MYSFWPSPPYTAPQPAVFHTALDLALREIAVACMVLGQNLRQ
jgi:hypothetical protein